MPTVENPLEVHIESLVLPPLDVIFRRMKIKPGGFDKFHTLEDYLEAKHPGYKKYSSNAAIVGGYYEIQKNASYNVTDPTLSREKDLKKFLIDNTTYYYGGTESDLMQKFIRINYKTVVSFGLENINWEKCIVNEYFPLQIRD